jgi:hypothetical protein
MLTMSVVEGARWALTAVFVLSAVEKGQTLWARSAAWHPLMLVSPTRRRYATALMSAALIADLAVIVLLAVLPAIGGPAAGALVAAYTWLALPVHSRGAGSCRCLWKLLDSKTRLALLGRNVVLFALALAVTLSWSSTAGVAGFAYGAGLLVGLAALVAGLDARPGSPATTQRQASPGRGERASGDELADAAYATPSPRGGTL